MLKPTARERQRDERFGAKLSQIKTRGVTILICRSRRVLLEGKLSPNKTPSWSMGIRAHSRSGSAAMMSVAAYWTLRNDCATLRNSGTIVAARVEATMPCMRT